MPPARTLRTQAPQIGMTWYDLSPAENKQSVASSSAGFGLGFRPDLEILEMPQWQGPAMALLGLTLGVLGEQRPATVSAPAALAAAGLGPCRPLAGRVSGFAYAPFPSACRASPADLVLFRRRLDEAGPERKPMELAGRAVLQLAAGRFGPAANLLRSAEAEAAPGATHVRALVASDLSAVTLAEASNEDDPYELTSSLAAANRAVHLDPKLPEAYFNRALSEERLFLLDHAAADWKHYLTLDANSPWAVEARRHLSRLPAKDGDEWPMARAALRAAATKGDVREVERLVARFRQQTRQYAEEDLFADWARSAELGERKPCRDSAIERARG